jgi:hypothetical protein
MARCIVMLFCKQGPRYCSLDAKAGLRDRVLLLLSSFLFASGRKGRQGREEKGVKSRGNVCLMGRCRNEIRWGARVFHVLMRRGQTFF